jgi:hypothetical protein
MGNGVFNLRYVYDEQTFYGIDDAGFVWMVDHRGTFHDTIALEKHYPWKEPVVFNIEEHLQLLQPWVQTWILQNLV